MATHSCILPGEFHGQRSWAGYSLWDHKESDTTEVKQASKSAKPGVDVVSPREVFAGCLLLASDLHEPLCSFPQFGHFSDFE